MAAIEIEVRVCDEDRARLDTLISRLGTIATALVMGLEKWKTAPAPVETPQETPEAAGTDDTPEATETPSQPAEAAAPEISLEEVSAAVRSLIRPGSALREKAKAIVLEYAPKVSGIPAEKRAEVLERLTALETESKAG